MVVRFLPSVKPKGSNVYSKVTRKTTNLSEVFTPSDEAWILILLENYLRRWRRMAENPESTEAGETVEGEDGENRVWSKGSHRKDPFFRAKYTSSENGKSSGWSNDGKIKFNYYIGGVQALRAKESSGRALESYLRDLWIGDLAGSNEQGEVRTREGVVEEAYTEEELFAV